MKKNQRRNRHRNIRVHVELNKDVFIDQPKEINIQLSKEVFDGRSKETLIEQPKQSKKTLGELLKEWVGLISAGAGIFATLLYLAGRQFASGYFSVMNIPNYHVSFSLWEYGEVAWLPMFLYPTFIFGIAAIIELVFSWIGYWLKAIFIRQSTKLSSSHYKAPKEWLVILALSFTVLFSIVFIGTTLSIVKRWGEVSGLVYIVQNSPQIDINSNTQLPLEINTLNTSNSYTYKDYQLITYNNGKYYLFKEIDFSTCKPKQVYIIDSTHLIQVNLRQSVSLASQCSKEIPSNIIELISYVLLNK